MTLTYVLLSPTFGMHQYTADLANRMAVIHASGAVRLVTTTTVPRDRYSPAVRIETPLTTRGTGFSREGASVAAYRAVLRHLLSDQPSREEGRAASQVVHFTGVHLWNAPLAVALRRRGVPVVHTLHDLAPHTGVRHGGLIRLWNRLIIRSGATILVHGRCYREQLLREGVPAHRVVCTPLLHGFWGWEIEENFTADAPIPVDSSFNGERLSHAAGGLQALFFGRLERYKGVDTLLEAWRLLMADNDLRWGRTGRPRLVLAGRVADGLALPELPPRVELRDRRIEDREALDLFAETSLLVLPYRDATQTALIAAAARLGVPVVVTRAGALPEYVHEGETGWIVPPDDPAALAHALAAALAGAAADPGCLGRMGAAGRRWYDAQRSEEMTVLTDLYRTLM